MFFKNKLQKEFLRTVSDCLEIQDSNIYEFYQARYAIFNLIKFLNLDKKCVAIPAFTSFTVILPFIELGYEILYIDIEKNDVNIEICKIPHEILEKISVIIIQHTFGKSTKFDKKILDDYNVISIEDCAHTFGLKDSDSTILGSKADFAIYSFGLEKMLRSRVGGILRINTDKYKQKFTEYYQLNVSIEPNLLLTVKWLLNPYLWKISNLVYKLTRYPNLHKIFRKINILDYGISEDELNLKFNHRCSMMHLNDIFRSKILLELKILNQTINHRLVITKIYKDILSKSKDISILNTDQVLIRFPVWLSDSQRIIDKDLGRCAIWYLPNIFPYKGQMSKIGYNMVCPNAERFADTIINLPTHNKVTVKDAEKYAYDIISRYK